MHFLGYFSKDLTDEKGREYYFDNAKFILIFLVVFAHAISPFKSDMPYVMMLWTVINTLHMPCLILISGYFAKSYVKKDGTVRTQRLFTYLIYYLAAQLAVSLFEYFVLGDTNIQKSVFSPRSSLWYLACLFWWFLVLPYIARMKPRFVLIAGFVFALLVGYDTTIGNFASMCRAVNHFPFFIIGYYFKKEWLFKFRNKYTQAASVVVLGLGCLATYFARGIISSRVITSNYNYGDSKLKILADFPFVHRMAFYAAALLLCAAFMLLVPRGKAFFTRFGSRTLQVYILHRFLYLAYLKYEWYGPLLGSDKGFLLMTAIALATTFLLSLKIFEYPFRALAKIKVSWIEKSEYDNSAPGGG